MYVFPFTEGSSPHARGALVLEPRTGVGFGIIPACAGSTRRPPNAGIPDGDHPRMRGEHSLYGVENAKIEGSSPHARGARSRP